MNLVVSERSPIVQEGTIARCKEIARIQFGRVYGHTTEPLVDLRLSFFTGTSGAWNGRSKLRSPARDPLLARAGTTSTSTPDVMF